MKNFVCINCGISIHDSKVGSIVSNFGETQFICRPCAKFVRSPLLSKNEVIIVPITKSRFKEIVLKNKIYYHPIRYNRKGSRYIAFYITSPISAITHYAKVDKIFINQNISLLPGNDSFDKKLFPRKKDYVLENLRVYYLSNITRIKPVLKGEGAIAQGTMFTSIHDLKKAKFISDLNK